MANPANRTQITRALLRLRELIISGEFAPGERMSELPLVERIGVSRTTVREASGELAAYGLVTTIPHKGAIVSVPSLQGRGPRACAPKGSHSVMKPVDAMDRYEEGLDPHTPTTRAGTERRGDARS